jgi:hypothetical protein
MFCSIFKKNNYLLNVNENEFYINISNLNLNNYIIFKDFINDYNKKKKFNYYINDVGEHKKLLNLLNDINKSIYNFVNNKKNDYDKYKIYDKDTLILYATQLTIIEIKIIDNYENRINEDYYSDFKYMYERHIIKLYKSSFYYIDKIDNQTFKLNFYDLKKQNQNINNINIGKIHLIKMIIN